MKFYKEQGKTNLGGFWEHYMYENGLIEPSEWPVREEQYQPEIDATGQPVQLTY